MKKKIKYPLIISAIIISILAFSFIYVQKNDNLKFKFDYELYNNSEYSNGKSITAKIDTNNKIKYIESNELMDFLNNDTGILYIGYSTCPWCRRIAPNLIDVVNEYDTIDTVYYFSTNNGLGSIKEELYKYLEDYLKEEDEEKYLPVPYVFFIKDGKVVYSHLSTVESYKDPFTDMTDEQKNELKGYYREGINLILEG